MAYPVRIILVRCRFYSHQNRILLNILELHPKTNAYIPHDLSHLVPRDALNFLFYSKMDSTTIGGDGIKDFEGAKSVIVAEGRSIGFYLIGMVKAENIPRFLLDLDLLHGNLQMDHSVLEYILNLLPESVERSWILTLHPLIETDLDRL